MAQNSRYIYKYHSLNLHLVEMLTTAKFHLSKRESLNDPFDMLHLTTLENFLNLYRKQYTSIGAFIKEDSLNSVSFLFERYLSRGSNDWVKLIDKSYSPMLISCFTEDGNNPLMWSHYANNHNGVCLKFNPSKDEDFKENIHKVKYEDKVLEIKELSDIKKSALTKLKPWSIEKEWRLIYHDEKFSFKHESLVEIVFGLDVPLSTISWFSSFMENVYYMHTPIYKLQVKNNELVKINIEELDEYY